MATLPCILFFYLLVLKLIGSTGVNQVSWGKVGRIEIWIIFAKISFQVYQGSLELHPLTQ